MTLGDGRTILDEIDALTARLAVWEQLRPDIETLLANRPTQCPHYGCDSTKARNWRIDCSDDQCLNPAHTRYERCTSTWHDQTEAADRITRTLKEQQP